MLLRLLLLLTYRTVRDAVAFAGQKCKPPSTGAKASELAITQTSTFEAAIHDGRPLSLLGAPLAIYSEAFTQFRATMSDDALQFNPTELSSARRLVDKAAKHTHKEELRVEAMVDLSTVHENILVEVTLQLSTNAPKKIIPDGRIRATSNYQHLSPILSLTEVNSEVGAGTCDPIDKAKQDYRAIYCSEKVSHRCTLASSPLTPHPVQAVPRRELLPVSPRRHRRSEHHGWRRGLRGADHRDVIHELHIHRPAGCAWTTAVELLHAEGLVFGEMRGPNVLLRKDGEPLLIDFDWCGPEGTACYPLGVNMHSAIPWHPDVNTGTLIKKEHDWHLLKVLAGS